MTSSSTFCVISWRGQFKSWLRPCNWSQRLRFHHFTRFMSTILEICAPVTSYIYTFINWSFTCLELHKNVQQAISVLLQKRWSSEAVSIWVLSERYSILIQFSQFQLGMYLCYFVVIWSILACYGVSPPYLTCLRNCKVIRLYLFRTFI